MNTGKPEKKHPDSLESTAIKNKRASNDCGPSRGHAVGNIYSEEEMSLVPPFARRHACGCDNPLNFVALQPNLSIVDLGCGGGLDAVLAAHKIGQEGRVFGIDIDRTMINQAKEAISDSGLPARSIKFYEADIESSKLPKSYADIVISNCTINLCLKKDIVLRNIYRILRPGAMLILSDLVFTGKSRQMLQKNRTCWCWLLHEAQIIAEEDYLNMLNKLSFTEITIGKHRLISREMMESMGYSTKARKKAHQDNKDAFLQEGNIAAITITAKRPPTNC